MTLSTLHPLPQEDDQPSAYAPEPFGPSSPRSNASLALRPSYLPSTPQVDFTKYALPESELSKEFTTRVAYHPTLYSDVEALERVVHE